jgi:hypothetical protein
MLSPSTPQGQAARTFCFVPKRGTPTRSNFNSWLSRKLLARENLTARRTPLAGLNSERSQNTTE